MRTLGNMTSQEQPSDYGGCGCILLVLGILVLTVTSAQGWGWVPIVFGVLLLLHAPIAWKKQARQTQLRQEQARQEQLEQEKLVAEREQRRQKELRREEAQREQLWRKRQEERSQEKARREKLRQEEARRAEEERKRQIDELLQRDKVMDQVHYMSGHEFERFMADLFRKQGYTVQQTPGSGDQGVDLLVDIDGRKVAVQLKRWIQPVGNSAVQATFSGRFFHEAQEAWLITTSSFTKSAKEAARRTDVRLIDGNELSDWMRSLKDEK